MNEKKLSKYLDFSSIFVPLIIVGILSILVVFFPTGISDMISLIKDLLGKQLSILYYLSFFILFIILIFIAFSKYGEITLGEKDKKSKISFFGWGAMIFCCGLAGDLIYFSCTDWLGYYQDSFINSLGDAFNYSVVHQTYLWTMVWIYFIVAVCLGYFMHVKKNHSYKYGESLRPIFGNAIDGILGKIINIFVIVILIIGVACTQCFSIPILTSCVCELFNIPFSNYITLFFMLVICAIYSCSVLNGLKGIEFLSKICIYVFLILIGYVLLFGGETINILGSTLKQTGMLFEKFVFLLTNYDPYAKESFVQDNNSFWIAYWYTWTITTPFFIAIISKGKKIKEIILGGLGFSIPGILLGLIIFPNYAMAKQIRGIKNFVEIYNANEEKFNVIVSIFDTLPFKHIALLIMVLSMICFTATSLDSLSLSASYFSYKKISYNDVPNKKIRLLWAFILMLLPIFITISKMNYLIIQDIVTLSGSISLVLIVLLVISFFNDSSKYLKNEKKFFNKK